MNPLHFGYTAQAKFGRVDYTYRPLLDIEVGGSIEQRTFKALVDSGSDITVMDKMIAEILQINSQDKEAGQISTLGQVTAGFLAPVSLKVEQFEQVFTFNVLFVENLSQNFDIILGQQDFFLNFDVTFKKSKNIFSLHLLA